ncbi:MAG: zinc-dependent peptidase [Burkholderiaceae bacterium]|nr:zinc-dependent peptidase [Burkholderiaceae bacterium]
MNLPRLLHRASRWLRGLSAPPPVPPALWQSAVAHYPFIARLPAPALARLERLARYFLADKQFTGAHDLRVTDAMAVAIAAQACLPLLWLGRPHKPETALLWYDDFVGIVLQPGEVIARRESMDSAGLVHQYSEVLIGEAMPRGPLMLSWPAVQQAGGAQDRSSVVIHECAHKMDMRSGYADGCPPLRRGMLGSHSAAHARRLWAALWEPAYRYFCEQLTLADRFGAPYPWLDPYAATAPAEFFAVACEAHFVCPEPFALEYPQLAASLREFFNQN